MDIDMDMNGTKWKLVNKNRINKEERKRNENKMNIIPFG